MGLPIGDGSPSIMQTNEVLRGRPPRQFAKPPIVVSRLMQLGVCTATAGMLGWVLWACGRGFDFTDEGLYLVWSNSPYAYSSSITQFGFVYHPLEWLLGGNIALLRQANVLLTFGLAWIAASVFLARAIGETATKTSRLVASAAFAGSSLVFFQLWLPSPNYNSLTFQALLVTLIGLVKIDGDRARFNFGPWLIVALGGWLAFMAKPTSALALALLCALYLLCARKLSVRGIAVSLFGAAALLVVGAWLIDGSIRGFINRILSGLELGHALGGGHEFAQMLRIDPIFMPDGLKIAILVGGAVAAVAALLLMTKIWFVQAVAALAVLAGLGYAIALAFGGLPAPDFGMFHGMLMLAAPLAGLVVFAACGVTRQWRILQPEKLAMIVACALLPFAYTFGTNNNYWVASGNAAYFWLLAGAGMWGLIKPREESSDSMLPMAVIGLIVTAILLQLAMSSPYRQLKPLRDNDHPTVLGRGEGSSLLLSNADHRYLEQFRQVGTRAGFHAGTPMIDLTGRSPGLLYAGGAHNVGQPWLIGGYPGSAQFVSKALDAEACDVLAKSWLLIEPTSPRAIPLTLLARYGIDAAADFVSVGEVVRKVDVTHPDEARSQQILKPSRDPVVATQACAAARAAQ